MTRKLFLPGAGGSAAFWRPVIDRLPAEWDCRSLSWPGLGNEPHDPAVRGVEDCVALVMSHMPEPVDLIAQSMGGLIALKVALCAPDLVRRLVLTGTSGGLPVERFGAEDWRTQYRRDYPNALPWIMEAREDLSDRMYKIQTPTLFIWGELDRVSPVTIGEKLRFLLPNARLERVCGGDHDFPTTHPIETSERIGEHLSD